MVAVKNLARSVHAGALLRLLAPGHFHAGVEIVAQHARFGAAERLPCKAVNVLEEFLFRFLVQVRLSDFCAVFVEFFVLAALADLVLQDFDLLAQDKILLNFSDAGADLAFNVLLHGGNFDLAAQNLVHALQSRQRAQLVEDILFVLIAQVELLGDKVSEIAGIVRR